MVALQAHGGDSDRSRNQTFQVVLASLEQSLGLLDEGDLPPHIGARLLEVIESLRDEISSRESRDRQLDLDADEVRAQPQSS